MVVVGQVEDVSELLGCDEFELVVVVMGAFGRDGVDGLVDVAVGGLDGRGIADGGAVRAVVVLPAVDGDGVHRVERPAAADARVGEVDVQRPGERFVAEAVGELRHVAGEGDVVAAFAHPARDVAFEFDGAVAFEDAAVVLVLAPEAAFARVGERDPLAVADGLAGHPARRLEALQASGGGLRGGVEVVGEGRAGRLDLAGEGAVHREAFGDGDLVVPDVGRGLLHTSGFEPTPDKHNEYGMRLEIVMAYPGSVTLTQERDSSCKFVRRALKRVGRPGARRVAGKSVYYRRRLSTPNDAGTDHAA